MEGDDTEEIKRLTEEMTQASHKLAEAMYQQASQADAQQQDGAGGAAGQEQAGPSAPDEDVVDADFEEVIVTRYCCSSRCCSCHLVKRLWIYN